MNLNIMDKAREVKAYLDTGQITYDEAVRILQEPIKEANERAKKVAKEYGMRPPIITATKLLRQ